MYKSINLKKTVVVLFNYFGKEY